MLLLLASAYTFSVGVASYANKSSVTGGDCEWRLVSEVAEYSCAAVVLLLLATCAARRLRSAAGRKTAGCHENLTAHPSSKRESPLFDCHENLTMGPSSMKGTPLFDYKENINTHPSSKKEAPLVENIDRSSGRLRVEQQHQRQLEVIEKLDRLVSLMPDDESETSSEFLLTAPRCRVYSQRQAFYSWSSSSSESSVPIEETARRKYAGHSPRKKVSGGLSGPENQGTILNYDDYGGTIKKRKMDDEKHVRADISPPTQCEDIDFAAQHNVVRHKTKHDAAAQTSTPAQKVTVDVEAQYPGSSRGLDYGTVQGAVGLDGTNISPQFLGYRRISVLANESEAEETDDEAARSCFLHNVPTQHKRRRVKASNISKPKNAHKRFSQLEGEVQNQMSPVTVYSKKTKLSISTKDGARKPETERHKLNRAEPSKRIHYMFSSLEEEAMLPHAHNYEEFKGVISPTTVDSMNETSFVSNNTLTNERTQRTQKFVDECIPETTQWDHLYSFPDPSRNYQIAAVEETDGYQSNASSQDDIRYCITGSNSSFEREADFIRDLRSHERYIDVVDRKSQTVIGPQLQNSTGRESERAELSALTINDVNNVSTPRIPGNQHNTFCACLLTTNTMREHCSNTETVLPNGQKMDGHSPKRVDTPVYQTSASFGTQTTADHTNYSQKQ